MKPIIKKKYLLAKPGKLPEDLLHEYCKDIEDWPLRWQGSKADLKVGKAIMEEFKRFIIHLVEKGRSKKTIRNHASYLWALGGELIRIINNDESQRRLPTKKLILKHVDDLGGPYWRHAYNEADHDRYDSVCRQFFKFFVKNTP